MSKEASPTKPAVRARSRSKSETRRSVAGTSKPIIEEDEKSIKQMENNFNHRWGLSCHWMTLRVLLTMLGGTKGKIKINV